MNPAKHPWRSALVAAALLQLLPAAPAHAGHQRTGGDKPDLVATAQASGSFKTLAAALKAADLVEALQGPGPFTVLAPTDEAFAKLPAGTVESLLKPENKEKLQAILKYHVLQGRVAARKVASLESARTLLGREVAISLDGGSLRVNQSRVIQTDLAAGNGIIHVLDTVLLPPDAPKPGASTSGMRQRPAEEVIELALARGVPLFNQGQPAACAAVYEVAAAGLIDRNDVPGRVRSRLNEALAQSRKTDDPSSRAWVLRHALDESRSMMN